MTFASTVQKESGRNSKNHPLTHPEKKKYMCVCVCVYNIMCITYHLWTFSSLIFSWKVERTLSPAQQLHYFTGALQHRWSHSQVTCRGNRTPKHWSSKDWNSLNLGILWELNNKLGKVFTGAGGNQLYFYNKCGALNYWPWSRLMFGSPDVE